MPRTYDDSPIVKTVKRLIEAQRKEFEQRRADMAGYVDGATTQFATQLGATMSVQAAMLEWLDANLGKPGIVPSNQIQSIVEQNIARFKAEKAAKALEESERKQAEEAPAVIAPEAPADAPADTPGSP